MKVNMSAYNVSFSLKNDSPLDAYFVPQRASQWEYVPACNGGGDRSVLPSSPPSRDRDGIRITLHHN